MKTKVFKGIYVSSFWLINFMIIGMLDASAPTVPTPLELIKQKWMDKANSAVDYERAEFLKQYGLEASCLNHPDLINKSKQRHAELCAEVLENYALNTEEKNKILHSVAQSVEHVFKAADLYDVTIIHDDRYEYANVGVIHSLQDNSAYVILNAYGHFYNQELLKDIIWHECSHVIEQDSFNAQLLECAAHAMSGESVKTIEEKMLPFLRACETRADIYAAINSPHHGRYLREFLVQTLTAENDLDHPLPGERIALLEQIQAELDAVSLR